MKYRNWGANLAGPSHQTSATNYRKKSKQVTGA